VLDGSRDAATAEALMRARYSAHARGDEAFLRRSWHPDTVPPQVTDHDLRWTGLEVRSVEAGRQLDRTGTVTFAARFERAGRAGLLVERSRFVRSGTRWLYLDGDTLPG
jgi:SEC-C motif-containing protein